MTQPNSENPSTPDTTSVTPAAAEESIGITMCFTKCWSCMLNHCYEPPEPHSWVGADDIDHARQSGLPEPTGLCACPCAQGAPA